MEATPIEDTVGTSRVLTRMDKTVSYYLPVLLAQYRRQLIFYENHYIPAPPASD